MDSFAQMQQFYRGGGAVPWDRPLPPPEVIAVADELPPGRFLDLGSGYGRASIYLAARGWACDGVDFIAEAVAEATRRAAEAGVAGRARFHVGSVTDLAFLAGPYDLALDVGCMHNLRGDDRLAYAAGVARLVRPGGRYLLFAHAPQGDRHGQTVEDVRALFAATFDEERTEPGTTTIPNGPTFASAWFWLRRRAGG